MNENEQNGLFSEDYETPKRENPYLKKNREKAKAEKTTIKKENPAEAASAYVATEDKPVRGSSAPGYATPEVSYVHKRTFSDWMFEHVKLIATIVTILVVLSLVLITDVVSIVENLLTQTQQADMEDLTLNYVKGLSEMSQPITWDNLEKFKRDVLIDTLERWSALLTEALQSRSGLPAVNPLARTIGASRSARDIMAAV